MKFKCFCCGGCCQGFRCLPAYEWELDKIKAAAKEKNIQLEIKPDWKNTFLDEVSGKAICIIYGIYNNPCEFLKLVENFEFSTEKDFESLDSFSEQSKFDSEKIQNREVKQTQKHRCINYDERLLICRQFPISCTPFFNLISPNSFGANSFFECKCFDCKKNFEEFFGSKFNGVVSKKEIEDYLIENYGEPYFYAKHVGMINETIKDLIEKFSREEKVRFVKIKEEDLGKYEVFPFFEFLVVRNLINEEEKHGWFKRFRNVKKGEVG